MINGDPAWVGPLAGISLGLPVFHIMEPEIREQIDPEIYKEHLSLMEIAMDVKEIAQALRTKRMEKDV